MFKRILVPIDGSIRAEHSARAAIELAKFLDASIIVLYVYPTLHIYPSEPFMAIPPELMSEKSYAAAQKKVANRYLGVIDKAARLVGVRCSPLCIANDSPAAAIVATAGSADTPCDLIFMGSHGRGAFSQLFLGSVTTKVQVMCDIPVLVYRDPLARDVTKKPKAAKKTKRE